jgi:hypothetical protein
LPGFLYSHPFSLPVYHNNVLSGLKNSSRAGFHHKSKKRALHFCICCVSLKRGGTEKSNATK